MYRVWTYYGTRYHETMVGPYSIVVWETSAWGNCSLTCSLIVLFFASLMCSFIVLVPIFALPKNKSKNSYLVGLYSIVLWETSVWGKCSLACSFIVNFRFFDLFFDCTGMWQNLTWNILVSLVLHFCRHTKNWLYWYLHFWQQQQWTYKYHTYIQ